MVNLASICSLTHLYSTGSQKNEKKKNKYYIVTGKSRNTLFGINKLISMPNSSEENNMFYLMPTLPL